VVVRFDQLPQLFLGGVALIALLPGGEQQHLDRPPQIPEFLARIAFLGACDDSHGRRFRTAERP